MSERFRNPLITVWTDWSLCYPYMQKICLDWVSPSHAFVPYPIFRRSATPNDSGDNSSFFVVYQQQVAPGGPGHGNSHLCPHARHHWAGLSLESHWLSLASCCRSHEPTALRLSSTIAERGVKSCAQHPICLKGAQIWHIVIPRRILPARLALVAIRKLFLDL